MIIDEKFCILLILVLKVGQNPLKARQAMVKSECVKKFSALVSLKGTTCENH